jgi:tight adherence protein C
MITMMLVGAAIGAVLFWLLLIVAPPKTSVLVQLGRFDARDSLSTTRAVTRAADPASRPHPPMNLSGLQTRLGTLVAAELERRGVRYTSLRQDLTLTARSFEDVMGRKLLGGLTGFLIVTGTAAGLGLTGVHLPMGSPLLLAPLTAVAFFFLPDLDARRDAAARRRHFRRTLSAYLDLVALEMAGSAAPAEALPNAARVGSGWPMALLRDTLFQARLAGRDPWESLTDLGTRIGVTELRDLGNLVELVGRDGARIRTTLTARAASLRRQDLADAEGQAGRRDQSMLLAQVLIGFGFIVFLGYPAVASLMAL